MRVITGKYKGRKLTPPADTSIRPTSERTRESLFNLLMHGQFGGANIIHQRVADICCGTGALGIEALSRGATHCVFVDQAKAGLELAKKNVEHIGATADASFILSDANHLPKATEPCALVMIDPPYDINIIPRVAGSLIEQGWVKTGSILVTEVRFTTDMPELPGFSLLLDRQYGKAKVLIWECI
ncbi:MAG: 16S rRNA (guanine(966)-N(2))-methyltransferase RsmD [Alphaproteobacteria bacterium]|nr:16S rRNA (guanine(966)-N(2))-methyltransferase RsmD [Alphaproteobacteria bacterium]